MKAIRIITWFLLALGFLLAFPVIRGEFTGEVHYSQGRHDSGRRVNRTAEPLIFRDIMGEMKLKSMVCLMTGTILLSLAHWQNRRRPVSGQ